MITLKLDIPIWMKVMTYIYNKNLMRYNNLDLTSISHDTKITYSHLHRVTMMLLDYGYIVISKDGRKSQINLTNKGRRLGRELYRVMNTISRDVRLRYGVDVNDL
jgi:predicted transcriptional regulator